MAQAQELHETLSAFDEQQLIGALTREDIRLVDTQWLLAQPDGYTIQRRQELEELVPEHGAPPLLSGADAVALIRNGRREVGVLTYGWLTNEDADPTGARAALLRSALVERPYIKALFWDQATLYQPPRTKEQDEAFSRGLAAMSDLYASPVGTT